MVDESSVSHQDDGEGKQDTQVIDASVLVQTSAKISRLSINLASVCPRATSLPDPEPNPCFPIPMPSDMVKSMGQGENGTSGAVSRSMSFQERRKISSMGFPTPPASIASDESDLSSTDLSSSHISSPDEQSKKKKGLLKKIFSRKKKKSVDPSVQESNLWLEDQSSTDRAQRDVLTSPLGLCSISIHLPFRDQPRLVSCSSGLTLWKIKQRAFENHHENIGEYVIILPEAFPPRIIHDETETIAEVFEKDPPANDRRILSLTLALWTDQGVSDQLSESQLAQRKADLLIGSKQSWSSRSEEVQHFRENISRFNAVTSTMDRPEELLVTHEQKPTTDYTPATTLQRRFRMRAAEVKYLPDSMAGNKLFLSCGVFFGSEMLAQLDETSHIASVSGGAAAWPPHEWLHTKMHIGDIPLEARLCMTLQRVRDQGSMFSNAVIDPVGWVNVQLYNHVGILKTGKLTLRLWPDEAANPIGTCLENTQTENPVVIVIEFDVYANAVHHTLEEELETETFVVEIPKGSDMEKIESVLRKDPLHKMTDEEKLCMWTHRAYLHQHRPNSLTKLLKAVNWSSNKQVAQAHKYLDSWVKLPLGIVLEMLDAMYADGHARTFAVQCLQDIPDDELKELLLQLTQVLKYEPYHDSALARFLLFRALKNRDVIGHFFFWYLKAELHVVEIRERFGLLLEEYLRCCGPHVDELMKQVRLVDQLNIVAQKIKDIPVSSRQHDLLRLLHDVKIPEPVQLPLDASHRVKSLMINKCKYLDSKKLPLWLVFQNEKESAEPLYVIFKAGDDLRQDQLTLQILRIMDKLWKREGLDMRLSPYGCVATGDEQGMIQVVLNSQTIASITKESGGALGGAASAFREEGILEWLKRHNRDRTRNILHTKTNSTTKLRHAIENFTYSCAGYCVFTCVLGIGDRHNDNVMLSKDGLFFHIDFGHFLGNFKKKYGFKRERAPFVFTPDFAYVLGGKEGQAFQEFVKLSCDAYNVVRRNSNLFLVLFTLMLSTGIPELKRVEDILFLREMLSVEESDGEAAEKFTKLIFKCLDSFATKLNNAIHIYAHQ